MAHGDGTFAIPDGEHMEAFAFDLVDRPNEMHKQAQRMVDSANDYNLRKLDTGLDGFKLCSDYCYNSGPFLSPQMFSEFITPYLAQIIKNIRDNGGYAIKHTDGNIMPILDQLVSCEPHALHSIDPMANVDIKEVKRLTTGKIALAGNVNCALMQTGSEAEVLESCEYCMTHAKPGGGYIYCTSNVPFKGLPPERYQLVLDYWRKHRDY